MSKLHEVRLRPLHRNLIVASAVSFFLGASSVQCGGNANGGSGFNGSGASGTGAGTGTGGAPSSSSGGLGGQIGIDVQTQDYSAEQIYASDPPPTSCDGGGMPPPVTGTPECPSDKNLPGCDCTAAGEGATAACWTGLRKNRDHGDCKDGTTTCVKTNETMLTWGPCNGEVLPTGTTGKAACTCFSSGHWAIANLSPCFVFGDPTMTTVQEGIATDATTGQCPSDFSMAPTNWSTDTLQVDCTGQFKLCYTIKAGDPKNPQPTDCVMATSCVSAYYPMANQVFTMPDLPGWITDASMTACAQQFYDSGGYGEMSVDGQSDECELVDKVFQRVTYCPVACNQNPSGPGCAGCMAGGGGTF